jgi:23S rRNA (uracil1939-C5)-methyltransferase
LARSTEPAAGEVAMVRIAGIATGGAGVGHLPDGRAVFVQRTAPGETVQVRVLEEKRRWASAHLLRVLEASPDRRAAPCPHYGRCGGCTLEHLAYPAQLPAKASLVVEALRRIGGVEAPVPEVTASPDEFRYRNRVSFTLVRLAQGRVLAGFHELEHPGRVLDIGADCLLPEPAVSAVWGRLRERWGLDASRLPAGARLRLTLRGTGAGAVSLLVDGGFGPGRPEELLAGVEGLASIWHRPGDDPERPAVLLAGAESLAESWQEEDVALSGAVFLQVNRAAAALLEEHVVALAGDVAGQKVVDAYCGVGLHARRLARRGARVTGIELDPVAVAEARRGAAATGDAAEFLEARVEDALPAALPAELVILNPPRAGLEAAVPGQLLAAPPARLVYVSCNPATLARDLGRLAGGFELRSIRCFDLFPQTAHVETVADLVRVRPAGD